jgi:tRNA A37 threonylcarbamoyladenosine biosynthesis protein TsaE
MLIGIEGDLGSGKTLYAVKNIISDYLNNKKIVSNTPLYNIEYELFDIKEFLNNEYREKLFNSTILLDEITVYMDCRISSSKQNLLMGYLVLQSRKRNIDIYYTTQDFDLIDYKRLFKYTQFLVVAKKLFYIDENNIKKELENYRHYDIINVKKRKDNVTSFNMCIDPFYKYYDTDYIIEPIIEYKKEKI